MTIPEPIDQIYRAACGYSRQARDRVTTELNDLVFDSPRGEWEQLRAARTKGGTARSLSAAGRALIESASPVARPYVTRAVRRLLAAVTALAEYQPEHVRQQHVVPASIARRMGLGRLASFATWAPTTASVIRLDDLRTQVRVALITLASLFEEHATPAARVLTVAQRVAAVVLEPTAAALVQQWCASLEREPATA